MLPKITTAIAVFGFLSLQGQAQLNVQSGATFFMQAGAQVTVQGDVQNAGTLNNDGSLRVQGSYTNTGTYTGVGSTGALEMYGTGNATLAPGAATNIIQNLIINKATATDVVTLTASTTVNTAFTLTQGVLTTNPTVTPAVALVSPATTPYTFAAGKEVVGSIRRTGWSNGATRVFNQPNMLVTTNAGTAPTDLTVTMIPNGDPTQGEREVKRKYTFATTGGTGYTANVRYPYAASELNTNTEPGLVPWTLVSAEWNARTNAITRDAGNDWVNITTIPAAELTQEWKLADQNYAMNVTAYLRGNWNNATTLMRNTLNTGNRIPLAQPYNAAPFNYAGTEAVGSIPNANVVDWVLVELRKPASGLPADAVIGTLIGRKAGFLLTNGTVVDLDGVTPLSLPINKQGTGNFIVVRHRNHVSAMSFAKASNATGDFTNNFSSLANVYQKPAVSLPVALLPGNATLYGLWQGDTNGNGAVTAADISLINTVFIGPAAGNTNVYNVRDINMDRNVTSADISLSNSAFLGAVNGSSSKIAIGALQSAPERKPVISHVPDEGNEIE
ncbi:MAG: hypothetical protein EOO13_07505 [Chitinophagaceae bacterium]|nr:MAG: hypothetical protein EOO13_07505 [Chitinophagaceae bacterium]